MRTDEHVHHLPDDYFQPTPTASKITDEFGNAETGLGWKAEVSQSNSYSTPNASAPVPTVEEIEDSAWLEAERRWGPMGSPEDWESCGTVLAERLHAALVRVAEYEQKCGGADCMGWKDEESAHWVRAERLRATEAELSRLREGLREIVDLVPSNIAHAVDTKSLEGRAWAIARRLLGEEK